MRSVLVFIIFLWGFTAFAQNPIQNIGNRFSGMQNAGNQSLQKRNLSDDSVSISFRYLDTARIYKMDSSIADFTVKFPIPNDYYYLGNTGSAAQSGKRERNRICYSHCFYSQRPRRFYVP